MQTLQLIVNGEMHVVSVKADMNLLEVLRDQLHITSVKVGCNTGDCGSCSVILDGKLVKSCITNAMQADGKEVVTLEGLTKPGRLHPLQAAFHKHCAAQCGFCTPGMIVAAKALLDIDPDPSDEKIKEWMSGNICRCTGYVNIIKAVKEAAAVMRGGDKA